MNKNYAVIYKDTDTNKIIVESGYTYGKAKKRLDKIKNAMGLYFMTPNGNYVKTV